MKRFLLLVSSMMLVFSCQKNANIESSGTLYFRNIKENLKDSVSIADFSSLDFSRSIITNPDSAINFLRIPFRGSNFSEGFILLRTNLSGNILQGMIVSLKKDLSNMVTKGYNGNIKMSSLNRKILTESSIIDGFISIFHASPHLQRSLVSTTTSRAEVVESSDGISFSTWVSLLSLLGGGSNFGYYSLMDETGGGGNGGGTGDGGGRGDEGNSGGAAKGDKTILIDIEPVENLLPINISKYLNCFANIPDAGSSCSITIFSDIPVDDHPEIFFDWTTQSPGHTFLKITKKNGSQSVTQNIGFYPVEGWKTIFKDPVVSKIVDNSDHEFNAGLKEDLTPEQLKKALAYLSQNSTRKYDIDDFNCTDFALDIFNLSRDTNPLAIPKYNIIGGSAPGGTRTPQGLYNRLVEMQQANVERYNITIPGIKEWAPFSNGPCN